MGSWWILLQELMRREPITNRLLIRVKLFLVSFYELSAILLAFLPTCRMRFFLPLSRFSSRYCSIWRFSLAFHILLRLVLHTLRCFTGRDEKNLVSTVWTSVAVIWSTDLRVEKESLNRNVKPHYHYYHY